MAHPTLGGLHPAGPAVLGLTSGCHVPGVPMTSPHSPPPPRAPHLCLRTRGSTSARPAWRMRGDRDGAVSAAAAAPGHDGQGAENGGGTEIVEREKVTGLGWRGCKMARAPL